jgi:hypothetical protein
LGAFCPDAARRDRAANNIAMMSLIGASIASLL